MTEATQKRSLGEWSGHTDEVDRAAPSIPPPPGWPELAEEALSGLAGEIVRTIDPTLRQIACRSSSSCWRHSGICWVRVRISRSSSPNIHPGFSRF